MSAINRVILGRFCNRLLSRARFSTNNRFLRSLTTSNTKRFVGYNRYFLTGTIAIGIGYVTWSTGTTFSRNSVFTRVNCTDHTDEEVSEIKENKITLYQFASCPFCNKVRTFLDYYHFKYNIVEVDPLFRREIKFSKYRKVPILIINDIQLNDSSFIISVLKSYLLGKESLEELLKYYPEIKSVDDNGKESIERANRYGIMYGTAFDDEKHDQIKDERKWRKWVDDVFVHTLSPNLYRTWPEAMQASDYFSEVGDFPATQRFLAKYCGAIIMYYVGRKMKKKYRLKDDVRESMYDEARKFTKALKKRKFLGGNEPNLADLAMFGVLRGIQELDTVTDLKKNTNITPWFNRMKEIVETHQGADNR